MTEAQPVSVGSSREYETIYVLRSDVTTENARRIASRIEEVTSREGGKLTQVETWGRRQLAYPIRNCKRGVYVYVKYVGGGALVSEIERNLRMLDGVLRFQTVQSRTDLDIAAVSVNPDEVKFEDIVPPAEPEEDESIERMLGLEPRPEREAHEHHEARRSDDVEDGDDEESGDASDSNDGEESGE